MCRVLLTSGPFGKLSRSSRLGQDAESLGEFAKLAKRVTRPVPISPEDGQRLGTARITNSPAELRKAIARTGKSPKVVLEATYGWYWAADTLAAAGRRCTWRVRSG